jgi:hypothetical protein
LESRARSVDAFRPPTSDDSNAAVTWSRDIELTLRKLRLSGMAETLQTRAMQAQAAQEPFMDTLAALLQDELDHSTGAAAG